jgi:hypothetical protein
MNKKDFEAIAGAIKNVADIELTEASKALFIAYAKDAGNWSGTPLVGGNVGGSKADVGNLTDLKKKGLITTFRDEGCDWITFTPAGREYARSLGVTIE